MKLAAYLDGGIVPVCGWCRAPIPAGKRRDSIYCSQRCRQAAHRFQAGCVSRIRATDPALGGPTPRPGPLRLAYADPPYPGLARRYYGCDEVDHGALLSRLQAYDGWALSTSARALPWVLSLCDVDARHIRVAAWVRGPRKGVSRWPWNGWEPVVYAGGRRVPSRAPGCDALVHVARPRLTDPARVVGAKPAAFVWWLFELLGALPGDELDDLFPGSGGISRAWALYTSNGAAAVPARRVAEDLGDASPPEARLEASRQYSEVAMGDACAIARSDASRTTSRTAARDG